MVSYSFSWKELAKNRKNRLYKLSFTPSLHLIALQPDLNVVGQGQGTKTSTWMSKQKPIVTSVPFQSSGIENNEETQQQQDPRVPPILVGFNNINANCNILMPISINNSLPCVDLKFGYGKPLLLASVCL